MRQIESKESTVGRSRRETTPSIDAVVFDMDGLILDTEPVYRTVAQRAAAGLGFELSDAFYLRLVGRTHRDSERLLSEHFGPAFPLDEFNDVWPGYWTEHIGRHGVALKPGFVELLAHVSERGWRYAIATSSDQERAHICLRAADLLEHFEHIVTGDTVPRGKPAPDIYLQAAERLGVDPARCVAFEDSEPGACAGLAAGMSVMMVPDLVQPSADLRARVHAVLETLHQAPAALARVSASATGASRPKDHD